ncbi:MAG TPA: 16S rRNA (cytidine(1402)-2'-O)-methyltransferase [Patescibacteria group bacterium]|nr:16S rRNA (cytidine(1402)-2'-O)-methyltransferase [Patescibacteria group bacterium]
MLGNLYLVATPIGNLEDITFRAIKTLKEVDLILCEDTRVTQKLLDHFDIQNNTLSYHQQSNPAKMHEIFKLLQEGKNLALVTDAGTPGISDPGNELINFLNQFNIKTISIPGASSLTSALSISGFNISTFMFIGFWPKKKAHKTIEKIKSLDCPVVFFESPFRISKTLNLLITEFGEDKRIFIGQELTKMHERTLRTSLLNAKLELEKEQKELGRVKGELVCILEG